MMIEKQDIKNLKKRYLIWLYKTTKETLDKIERKFTQLEIDRFILNELKNSDKDKNKKVKKFIHEFERYIQNKEKESEALKYEGKQLKPDYYFLVLKLEAIQKAIVKELGCRAREEIKSLYEREMLERIIKSTQTK